MSQNLLIILLIALLAGLGFWPGILSIPDDRSDPIPKNSARSNPAKLSPGEIPFRVRGLGQLGPQLHDFILEEQNQITSLQAEKSRLAAVLDQMTDGVLITDPSGVIRFANPAATRMFELGEPVGGIIAEALRQHQLIEAWRLCQEGGEMQVQSVEMPKSRQFLQLIAIPDRYSGGSLLLIQDLTRVRHLETVRRDFVSNISHELRTPLASLKALTETLQDGALEDPQAARRFLVRIEAEVDALTQMVAELLELSRIESGQVPLDLKPVNPATLLYTALDRMRLQVERAALTLSVVCPPDLPSIRADAPRLEQVLVNLIHNSVKFTPPGGRSFFRHRYRKDSSIFRSRILGWAFRRMRCRASSSGSTRPTAPAAGAAPGWDSPSAATSWKRTAGAFGWRAKKARAVLSSSPSRSSDPIYWHHSQIPGGIFLFLSPDKVESLTER